MSRVSTAAAIEIQSCFRIALARKAARVLFARIQEERTFSATRIQSLVRLNIAKRRFERSISSVIAIQSFFRVIITKRRKEEAVQFHYYNNKRKQQIWSNCCKMLALIGVIIVVLCFLINRVFIYGNNSNNKSKDIDTNNSIIQSQTKGKRGVSVVEPTEETVIIEVPRSVEHDGLYEMLTALQSNNNSAIISDVWSEKSRLREIVLPKEAESYSDIFMENDIARVQEKIELGMVMEEIVEISPERNSSIERELDLVGSQEILFEWRDTLTKDDAILLSSDYGNKMYHLMVSPYFEEEFSGEDEGSEDHSEIVKVFAEQFRMEHVFSVQNFGSDYI